METGSWVSLYRWIARKPRTSAGANAFPYTMPTVALYWTFIGVSAVETVAVDFLLHRWPVPRSALLALGLWGVVFMVGMLASMKVNPHEVSPDALVVRHGSTFTARFTWSAIGDLRQQTHTLPTSRTFQSADDGALHVAVTGQTNLVLTLHEPHDVELPDRDTRITELRFWADDPSAVVALARGHLSNTVA